MNWREFLIISLKSRTTRSRIIFKRHCYFPNWFFSGVVTLFIAFALYEFYLLVANKGILVYRYFGIIIGILVPVVTHLRMWIITQNIEPLLIIIACLCAFILQLAFFIYNQNKVSSAWLASGCVPAFGD